MSLLANLLTLQNKYMEIDREFLCTQLSIDFASQKVYRVGTTMDGLAMLFQNCFISLLHSHNTFESIFCFFLVFFLNFLHILSFQSI